MTTQGTTDEFQQDLERHYRNADLLGVTIIRSPLKRTRGLWIWDHRMIVLRTDLTPVQERSTLAHELAHAVLGHRESTAINEWQADRFAATHLIDRNEFLQLWDECRTLREVADALQVTRRLVLAYAGLLEPTAIASLRGHAGRRSPVTSMRASA